MEKSSIIFSKIALILTSRANSDGDYIYEVQFVDIKIVEASACQRHERLPGVP